MKCLLLAILAMSVAAGCAGQAQLEPTQRPILPPATRLPLVPVTTPVAATAVATPRPAPKPPLGPTTIPLFPTATPTPSATRFFDDLALLALVRSAAYEKRVDIYYGHVENVTYQGTTLIVGIKVDPADAAQFSSDVTKVAIAFDTAADKTAIRIEQLQVMVGSLRGGPETVVRIRPADIRAYVSGQVSPPDFVKAWRIYSSH